jgi:gamma-D-glutamyl-L-lysine dipeptidyl-peptidase
LIYDRELPDFMKSSDILYFGKYIGLFALILFVFSACNQKASRNIQSEIDSISAKFVPDKRIGIFDVTCTNGKGGKLILKGETTSPSAKYDLINTLNNQGIKLIDSILILPDTLANKKFMGLTNLSVINLRKLPDHQSELVSQSILGTPVFILKQEDGWLLIQTPDNYIAWTERSSVNIMDRPEIDKWKKADRVIFMENSGWIYSVQSNDSGVVGDLVAGCIMVKDGESNDYDMISLPDGRRGFVLKKELEEFDAFRKQVKPEEEKIIQTASSLLGVPYLWGGSSAKGVDCSGFVQRVYFMNGVILMRDASLQALHGTEIDISNGFGQLRKGDLLFFGSGRNLKHHVTHVAIYQGNNEYINSSGRVLVNSLDSASTGFVKYRLFSLLSARRIIGTENDPGIIPLSKHPWY